jgi:hypothetical protein
MESSEGCSQRPQRTGHAGTMKDPGSVEKLSETRFGKDYSRGDFFGLRDVWGAQVKDLSRPAEEGFLFLRGAGKPGF